MEIRLAFSFHGNDTAKSVFVVNIIDVTWSEGEGAKAPSSIFST
jgi:hypothetical protein